MALEHLQCSKTEVENMVYYTCDINVYKIDIGGGGRRGPSTEILNVAVNLPHDRTNNMCMKYILLVGTCTLLERGAEVEE